MAFSFLAFAAVPYHTCLHCVAGSVVDIRCMGSWLPVGSGLYIVACRKAVVVVVVVVAVVESCIKFVGNKLAVFVVVAVVQQIVVVAVFVCSPSCEERCHRVVAYHDEND